MWISGWLLKLAASLFSRDRSVQLPRINPVLRASSTGCILHLKCWRWWENKPSFFAFEFHRKGLWCSEPVGEGNGTPVWVLKLAQKELWMCLFVHIDALKTSQIRPFSCKHTPFYVFEFILMQSVDYSAIKIEHMTFFFMGTGILCLTFGGRERLPCIPELRSSRTVLWTSKCSLQCTLYLQCLEPSCLPLGFHCLSCFFPPPPAFFSFVLASF